MTPQGPAMVMAFVRPEDTQIVDTWHVTGLRATGTQDLYVEGLFVPDEMSGGVALPAGMQPVRECVLAGIPFFTLLGLAQSPPVCLGIARHAIEEFRELAQAKEAAFVGGKLSEQVQAQVGLARAEALLRSARCYWYENVERIWECAVSGQELASSDLAAMRLASLTAVENGLAAVDALYRLAGTSSIFQSSPLERCWRDIHTAAQHVQVQLGRWETAGRVLFGMDPGSPVV
jgi:alkylation response protein AidB-like acyl-CoA dehydrogenase